MDLVNLHLRKRRPLGKLLDSAEIDEDRVSWNPSQTAVIVCDMWDRHWCPEATDRVDELAPFVNRVLGVARSLGMMIVHSPSETMEFYQGFPQRQRVLKAPNVAIPVSAELPVAPPLPIDASDGGCSRPLTEAWKAWRSQHAAIFIEPEDGISDDGDEIYRYLIQHEIENVLMVGVHTNMCILVRSFGLCRLVGFGFNTVLIRDLTDSMYHPSRAPYVSHFKGTELVVNHIEAYICPTVLSSDLTGEAPFQFREDSHGIGAG